MRSDNGQTNSWQIRLGAGDRNLRVHLIGIGGAGLSAIATVLLEMGLRVSGSDNQDNPHTRRLADAGATIYPVQKGKNLTGLAAEEQPDVVLISSAVPPDNTERRAAADLGLPVVKRHEFLPALLSRRTRIAIAGTHGKSTITAMTVKVLREAGIEVGYIIGTELPGYGNASAGTSDIFVVEADEYDHMFLSLNPKVAVITTAEWDHPDCYPTPASFRRAFMQFVDTVDRSGLIISCIDAPSAEELRVYGPTRGDWITYGFDKLADLQAVHADPGTAGYQAELLWWRAPIGTLRLQVPGRHNLWNAMAALAVAQYCGVDIPKALDSLGRFTGTARRFELKGEAGGVTVIDDYAHHPTELRETLAAARTRYPQRRIWAVFQPHTYSRTRHLFRSLETLFQDADQVIVTDIFAAREKDSGDVKIADLVAASEHPNIWYLPALSQAARHLGEQVASGDVVITFGAGDCYRIGEMLLDRLQNEELP